MNTRIMAVAMVVLASWGSAHGQCTEPCDTDCDGSVNALDIEPFLNILFGDAEPCRSCAGDANGDGVVDAFDIEFFLACLFPPGTPDPGVGPPFRIFFDESGNAGSDDAPHPGSGTLSYGNPDLAPGGGRLYIYGEFQADDQTVLSPNFDITIDGGTITGAWNYNGFGQNSLDFSSTRWNVAAPNPLINPGGNSVSFTSANLIQMGLKNGVFADNFDGQHDNTRNFGDTLLGYIDVEAPGAASVWLTVGEEGFALLGGGPDTPIFFGYGDASVPAGDVDVRTLMADATIGELLCGNGDLNAGEECDDGNTDDGDCCSSACTFEPLSAPCEDGDACTVGDTCDAQGNCVGGPIVEGTSCDDGDPCTVDDTCDDQGTCVGGPSICGEACCFPNGACGDILPLDCVEFGGTPQGAGTECTFTGCSACPEDLDGNGEVRVPDLIKLLAAWGTCGNGGEVCDDDVVQGSEVCDGSDLQGETCISLGFSGGVLACLIDCTGFDTSGCF